MTQTTHVFQAEVQELLHLVIHSLYTHKEIFLRELISNASDALDKLRVEALKAPELLAGDEQLCIRLEVDAAKRVLCLADNGIGMSREELVSNLGTIARSGTKHFAEALRQQQAGKGTELPRLIGQFGVGFYSAFMVAAEVLVETRRAGAATGTRWRSKGDGSYSVEDCELAARGTRVILELRAPEAGEEHAQDFIQKDVLREVVKRYSDFVEYPIRFLGEETPINSMKPLWTRPKSSLEESDYSEFYKNFTGAADDPLETVHFVAEGAQQYTALLFVPKQRPFEFFEPDKKKSRVHLYVKRVHIQADCEELLPPWLRFVRGLVDSDDLPLNVSRETLQHSRPLQQIQKRLVKRLLETLAGMQSGARERYQVFWDAFGPVLKEGIYLDDNLREELAALVLARSTRGPEWTSLAEYVGRMPTAQQAIYVLFGRELELARRSPHLEALAARGQEVLLFTDPVDEFVLQRLTRFQGRDVKAVDRGDLGLEQDEQAVARKQAEQELEALLEPLCKTLGDQVSTVRFGQRLTSSPAALVAGQHDLSPELERMLRESGQYVPTRQQVLELNATHPLVRKLDELRRSGSERFATWSELLYHQALVAQGQSPRDPARFAALLSQVMLEGAEKA